MKRRKLQWYGHITRHDSLAKTILQGPVEGGRKRGKPRKSWLSNIKEWTQMDVHSLLSSAQDRQLWRSCASQLVPLRHKPRPGKMMIMMRWNSIQDMASCLVFYPFWGNLDLDMQSKSSSGYGMRLVRLYLGTKYEVCMIICPVV